MKNCKICDKLFEHKNKEKQTCSKKCSYVLRGQGTAQKLKKSVSNDEIEKIKEVLAYGYVYDLISIIHHSKVTFGFKVMLRLFNTNVELNNIRKEVKYKALPTKIQKLSPIDFNTLLEDYKILPYAQIAKKWLLPNKMVTRLCHIFYEKNPRFKITEEGKKFRYDRLFREDFRKLKGSKNESWLEKLIRGVLLTLDINFLTQIHIKPNKYKCDFIIKNTNKIIEVNGDYWHGYNKNYEELEPKVKELVNNYITKKQFYKDKGYELLEIWEHEINNNLGEVIKKIKKYVEI